jgi:hypothetical protein
MTVAPSYPPKTRCAPPNGLVTRAAAAPTVGVGRLADSRGEARRARQRARSAGARAALFASTEACQWSGRILPQRNLAGLRPSLTQKGEAIALIQTPCPSKQPVRGVQPSTLPIVHAQRREAPSRSAWRSA